MKSKKSIVRETSRIFLLMFYLADILTAYFVTENWQVAVMIAIVIPIILKLQLLISLISLKAHSLERSRPGDAALLRQCMNEVMTKSVSKGRKKRDIKLYIADNQSLNAYTVGSSIIVNRGLLAQRNTALLESILSHELSHVYNADSFFAAILELHVLIGVLGLGIMMFQATAAIVLIVVIALWMVSSFWTGVAVGRWVGMITNKLFYFLIKAFHFLCRALSAILYRAQENEADAYAVLLGYGKPLKFFLEASISGSISQPERTWIECLLDDHPSDEQRIARIERLEQQLAVQSGNISQNLPYQNLF